VLRSTVLYCAGFGPRPGGQTIPREAAPEYHATLKDLPPAIRPRERLQTLGPQALSDEELVAILLRTGTATSNVLEVARNLLVRHHGLGGVNRASLGELSQTKGIGAVKAVDLKAALEVGKRLVTLAPEERPQITGPQDIYGLLRGEMAPLEHESVRVVLLNTKNRVLQVKPISQGSLNSSVVRVAEVFRDAIREQAAAIVLTHNHPSGDPTPSADDVAITRRVVEAGALLDIDVLDHIIIGQPSSGNAGWVSLRECHLGFPAD
jgi:DNA repair protein RadC